MSCDPALNRIVETISVLFLADDTPYPKFSKRFEQVKILHDHTILVTWKKFINVHDFVALEIAFLTQNSAALHILWPSLFLLNVLVRREF